MRVVSLSLFMLLSAVAGQAQAWWNNPYGAFPSRLSYWPSVWPAYVQPQYNRAPYAPYGYNGTGWNVKGSMNQRGDTHFVIEYNGNIYGAQYPGFIGNQYNMNGWRR